MVGHAAIQMVAANMASAAAAVCPDDDDKSVLRLQFMLLIEHCLAPAVALVVEIALKV